MIEFGGVLNFNNSISLTDSEKKSKLLDNRFIDIDSFGFLFSSNSINKNELIAIHNQFLVVGEIELINVDYLKRYLNTDLFNVHHIIVLGYQKEGPSFFSKLKGEFSFVLVDKKNKKAILVRDRIGIKPLYYSYENNRLIFSNRFKNVQQFQDVSLQLNKQWIVFYLSKKIIDKEQTIFLNINKVLPSTIVTVQNHYFDKKLYWDYRSIQPNRSITLDEAKQGVKKALELAISKRINTETKIGVELSGGLDSSCITGVIANLPNVNKNDIYVYSNILSKQAKDVSSNSYDEWDKASKVVGFLDLKNHIPIQSSTLKSIQLIDHMLDVHGLPSTHLFTGMQMGIYRTAHQYDNTQLFCGFGGDEVLSETANTRYFSNLLVNKGFFSVYLAFRELKLTRFKALKKTIRLLLNRLQRKELKKQEQILSRLREGVLVNDIHLDEIKFDKKYKLIAYYPLNQSLTDRTYFHLQKSGLAERLETGYSLTNALGISYKFPLLDVDLITYYISLSEQVRGKQLTSRYLFRNVLSSYLPKEIVNQSKPSNSYSAPYMIGVIHSELRELVNYCMLIPKNHSVFNFVDYEKLHTFLHAVDYNIIYNRNYHTLMNVIMLHRFFDKNNI